MPRVPRGPTRTHTVHTRTRGQTRSGLPVPVTRSGSPVPVLISRRYQRYRDALSPRSKLF